MRTTLYSSASQYDYTKGPVGKGVSRLAIPSCVEQIVYNVDGVAEIFWVGQLGPEYLAAMAVGHMAILFASGVGLGLRIAGQTLVAQQVGARNSRGASLVVGQTMMVTFIYSMSIAVLGFLLSPFVMGLLSFDPTVVDIGTSYLRAGCIAFTFIEGNFALALLLRGAGEPGYALAGTTVAMCVSVILLPIFIFGAGQIPPFGLAGAFYSIAIGRLSGLVTMSLVVLTGRSRLSLRVGDLWPSPTMISQTICLAWPVSIQNVLERGANVIFLRLLSLFGAHAVAASGLSQRVFLLARIPGFGLQAAARTLVGQNIGAGRPKRAIRSVRFSLQILAALMSATIVFLFIFAVELVSFFGMKGEATNVGVKCLRIVSAGFFFEPVRRVLAGAFQGAKRTRPPMVVEIVQLGMQLPGAYVLAVTLGWGAPGIWGVIAGGQVLGAISLLIWFFAWSRQVPSCDTQREDRCGT